MISKRIFGSTIDGKVKQELERRQNLTRNEDNELESIQNNVLSPEFSLSERTPFVRMWTSLRFIQPELIEEVLQEFPISDKGQAADSLAYQRALDFQAINPITLIKNKVDEDGEVIAYQVYDPTVRDRVDYAKQTYIVGDFNYQEKYGESLEKQSNLKIFEGADDEQSNLAKDAFPRLLKDNPLLKPQAGITGISSETQEFLGAIKKTTVNFVVHNFYDFDRIYNRYFLKPGATIFVDFGWSDITSLYDPDELLESNDILDFLYNDETGIITQNPHKLEVVEGLVVDYNSKILQNGSVECSLTIQSSNSALFNQSIDTVKISELQDILTNGARYLGIIPTLGRYGGDEEMTGDLKKFLITPNVSRGYGTVAEFEKNLKIRAKKELSGDKMTPEGNSVRTGVYVSNLNADDVYVSIGFFEDIVINERFGFGKDLEEIKSGKNLNVRMDSSETFTSYSDTLLLRQASMEKGEKAPIFLYPASWGDDLITPRQGNALDPDGDSEEGIGSFNYQQGKFPSKGYETDTQSAAHTTQDIDKKRIPIRELFINCEEIISSFESENNNSLKDCISDILRKMNNESGDLFNLTLVGGGEGVGNEIRIVDNNKVDTLEKIQASAKEADEVSKYFKDMFTFNVMSPNSIIRDYNLEFSLPTSEQGTMYAINAMGNENSIFPAGDVLDNVAALAALDKDALSIIYQPDMGGYRAEQISNEDSKEGTLFNVYQNAKNLISTDVYDVAAKRSSLRVSRPLPFRTDDEYITYLNTRTKPDKNKSTVDLMNKNIKKIQNSGDRVAVNPDEYFRKETITEEKISIVDRPNLLPFNLSLTIYGISSLQPGDTFRVDYLPTIYQKNTFCQVMHVKHDVNSDGWFTTLETQFRPLPEIKKTIYKGYQKAKPYLSPTYLQNEYRNINTKHFYSIPDARWVFGNGFASDGPNAGVLMENFNGDEGIPRTSIRFQRLLDFMTNIEIKTQDYASNFDFIDFIVSFKVTDDVFDYEDMYDINQGVPEGKWIGSFQYENPKKVVFKPNTGIDTTLQRGYGYNTAEAAYPNVDGAINDILYYQPFPVQFKPGETLFFVHHSDECAFFTDKNGIKSKNLEIFDNRKGQQNDYNKNRRLLTTDEIEREREARHDYTKPSANAPKRK